VVLLYRQRLLLERDFLYNASCLYVKQSANGRVRWIKRCRVCMALYLGLDIRT